MRPTHWFYTFWNTSGYYTIETYGLGDTPVGKFKYWDIEEVILAVKSFLAEGYEFAGLGGKSRQWAEDINYQKKLQKVIPKVKFNH